MLTGLSCEFYADNEDLADIVRDFSALGRFKYVQQRSALNRHNQIYINPADILPAALVAPERPTRYQSFLIMDEQQEVFARDVVLADGTGKLFRVDQNSNWDSVVIAFGGDAGDRTLIMSDISTVGDTEKARQMHKKFKKLVWSKTVRVGPRGTPYRLMRGALSKAKAGWRLARDKAWALDTDAQISSAELAAF